MNERSRPDDHPADTPPQTPRTRTRRAATAPHSRVSSRSKSAKPPATSANDRRATPTRGPAAGFGEPRWPGDTRPPFAPGNQLAVGHGAPVVHGAYSDRSVAERAELVHDHLLEVCPWLSAPHFAPAVLRYAQATAREQLAHEGLMASSRLSPRLLEAATAAARLAWQMADALGMTPAGHARLKMLVAGGEHAEASLADLAAEGRAVRERAERRQDALAPVIELGGTEDQEGHDAG